MLNKVRHFILQQQLLDHHGLYLVALSGGADSVALLRSLLMLNYQVEAVHCNFHLRGKESDRDQQFVEQLCNELSVKLHLAHFDTRIYAEIHHVSIEMAARELRYHYFEQLRRDIDATAVCVAHHRDDNVETLLINLLRGTGIHGLTGIHPKRENQQQGIIIRPLLCVSRKEIEAWLSQIGQSYVTDSTNLIDDIVRNKVRLHLIPLLLQINPSAIDNLQTTILFMGEAERVYDASMQPMLSKIKADNTIAITELMQTPSPLCLLFEWLTDYGFSSAMIQQIAAHLDAQTGRFWQSATHELCIDRGRLLLSPIEPSFPEMRIPEPGVYVIQHHLKFRVSLQDQPTVVRRSDCACLDASKVKFPLTIRAAKKGDRFVPFGMKGSRLVSDFLTDQKVPLPEKRKQLVVTDADEHILWIVNRRPAAPCCVSADTQQTLLLKMEEQDAL